MVVGNGTPTMRVCFVTDGTEDFSVRIVTDQAQSSIDVEVVECGVLSDARVKVVTEDEDASEFIFVVT